jgi:hypothetical protein
MTATQTALPQRDSVDTGQLAQTIARDCDRALRRLDRLNRERPDVLLAHARQLIQHAAVLSHALEQR